jgi:2-oxoglutarate ferredoxin oxidoreductase subunit alpha
MPVIILLDEVIGHMREKVVLPEQKDIEIVDRKRTTLSPAEFEAYKPDADEIPPMMPFGEGYYHHVTGLMHNHKGQPALDGATTKEVLSRLHTKIERVQDEITLYTEHFLEDAEVVVISYGGSARAALTAVKQAREQGIKVGMLKLITIWPFPKDLVQKVAAQAQKVIVPEMNYGQLVGEIERYVGQGKVVPVNRYDGHLFHPDDILTPIIEAAGGAK